MTPDQAAPFPRGVGRRAALRWLAGRGGKLFSASIPRLIGLSYRWRRHARGRESRMHHARSFHRERTTPEAP